MNTYYNEIAEHYNREAESYEQRLQHNRTLLHIRNDFRRVADLYICGDSVLDLGCGPGSDLCYFAARYPQKTFTGMDLSGKMIEQSRQAASRQQLTNIKLETGSIGQNPGQTFDFIYVFFGALNTVPDLREAALQLSGQLNDQGRLLLTFVNKWYPVGMLAYLRRLKFGRAFERLREYWGGYSEKYPLRSKTYFGRQVCSAFSGYRLLYKRGYSIVYPAWFQDRITQKLGRFSEILWRTDNLLSKTPLWSWGDYTLFVFEKKKNEL